MRRPLFRLKHAARRALRDEHGGGTVFALIWSLLCLILAGIAIDGTNAWRFRQLLQQTADVAAHAGVVALARGETDAQAHAAALAAVQFNMASSKYGSVINDADADILLVHYDDDTNTVSLGGTRNAVSVTVHRSTLNANPVETFLLKLAALSNLDFAALRRWNVAATGVAALVETKRCNSPDGIYAKGQMTLTSQNAIGAGYCLHSQTEVWLPQQNSFGERTGLSMPDLVDCGSKCVDSANPGVEPAAFERNLLLTDLGGHIAATVAAFTDESVTSTAESDFWAGKALDTDLQALTDIGIDPDTLDTGSVVALSQAQFTGLARVPEGLTYAVTCTANGNGPGTIVDIDSSFGGDQLEDIALITNCTVNFGADAAVEGSLVVTTRVANSATLTAESGARAGDPSNGCAPGSKTYIMSASDMSVPADFTGSNIAFMVDADVNVAAASSSGTLTHNGTSIHATGDVQIAAQHQFNPCNEEPSGLMPKLRVIRHVAPANVS